MNYITQVQDIYYKFLGYFPVGVQPIVSVVLAIFIIYSAFRIVRKDFIFIIVLIVLVPGSVPILKSVWAGLLTLVKFLFGMK